LSLGLPAHELRGQGESIRVYSVRQVISAIGAYMVLDDSAGTAYIFDNLTF